MFAKASLDAAAAVTTTSVPVASVRVLFIGDSFSMWLDSYFSRLVDSGNPPLAVVDEVIWGAGKTLSANTTLERIRVGQWNVIVLQDDLADHWAGVTDFLDFAHRFDKEIKQARAQTVLYMPWVYKGMWKPTTADIGAVYAKSGKELSVRVAPVGFAFERSLAERPDLDLYRNDGVHPNVHGFYLLMCVLYATVFERSPVGLSYQMADVSADSAESKFWEIPVGWTMSDGEAAFLQTVAWGTVASHRTP
jgi:hypothetical protein